MRQETVTLLGYQRAEHQAAERRQSIAGFIEFVILAVALIALIIPDDQYALFAALISFVTGIVWQLFVWLGRRSHYVAERARRTVFLDAGLGIGLVGKAYSDLRADFSVSQSAAAHYEDSDFYTSSLPEGYERLADILSESAFWSKHLFRSSAMRSWVLFVIFILVAVACLVLLSIAPSTSARILGAHIVCVVLAWLVTGSMLSNAAAFSIASIQVDDIESRLDNVPATAEGLLPILGDYNAVVQTAPTIPSGVYRRKQSKLNMLWRERPTR